MSIINVAVRFLRGAAVNGSKILEDLPNRLVTLPFNLFLLLKSSSGSFNQVAQSCNHRPTPVSILRNSMATHEASIAEDSDIGRNSSNALPNTMTQFQI